MSGVRPFARGDLDQVAHCVVASGIAGRLGIDRARMLKVRVPVRPHRHHEAA